MSLARCQVVLKHVSGLPRDNVTNTFWVDMGPGDFTEAEAEDVAELIRDFYVADPPGYATMLASYLSPSILSVGHEIKVAPINAVDGEDTRGDGFPPLWVEVFDLVGRVAELSPLPSEVACCLSFKNMTSGATPPARRRGRIFFGPLGPAAIDDTGDIARPIQRLQDTLHSAGSTMRDALTANGTPWVVYSRPYEGRAAGEAVRADGTPLPAIAARLGSSLPVTHLWIDNAFDTIRKRGERATARTGAV